VIERLGHRDVETAALTFFPGNARRGNVAEIRKSVARLGQYRSVVVRDTGAELVVLAGNHTVQALAAEGHATVACEIIRCTDDEARRVNISDNRLGELPGPDGSRYDDDALVELLSYLDGDYDGTGWTEEDVEALITPPEDLPPAGRPDAVPDLPAGPPVTQPGDIWLLGPHRVICGDCRDHGTIERLLAGAQVNVAFTSPPYADRRVYDESSGFRPIPPDEYVDWFEDVQANVRAHLTPDGSWFINIKPGIAPDGFNTELYVLDLVIAHVRRWGWHFATEFCWERNGVPKSVTKRFKNQFEPVYQFTTGVWKMRPDAVRHWSEHVPTAGGPGVGQTAWDDKQGFGTGRLDKPRLRANGTAKAISDVQGVSHDAGVYEVAGMAYPGNRLPTFAGTHEATGHTAAYPVGLPAWFMKAYTDPGDTVLDPFMGSGSTLIAACQENRVAYGCEISPAYCDVICARFERFAGIKPERVLEDGTTEPVSFT